MKRKYDITVQDKMYRVELADEYGNQVTVYEPTHTEAYEFAHDWFISTEERNDKKIAQAKALKWCFDQENK